MTISELTTTQAKSRGLSLCSSRKPTPYKIKQLNDKSPLVKSFCPDLSLFGDVENEVVKASPVKKSGDVSQDLITLTPLMPSNINKIVDQSTPVFGPKTKEQKNEIGVPDLMSFELGGEQRNDDSELVAMLKDKIEFLEDELTRRKPVEVADGDFDARETVCMLESEVAELKASLAMADRDVAETQLALDESLNESNCLRQEVSELKNKESNRQCSLEQEQDQLKKSFSIKECGHLDRIAKLQQMLQQVAEEKQEIIRFSEVEREAESLVLKSAIERAEHLEEELNKMKNEWNAADTNATEVTAEFEVLEAENDALIRKLRYVTNKLVSQQGALDASVPTIGHLAKELKRWFEKEAHRT